MDTNTQIAFLRAINVAGHGQVAMSDLRQILADLGCRDVRSVLQTGNLLFRTDGVAGPDLESRLETEMAARLGLRTDCMVRAAEEWAGMIERNPFPEEAERDPGHLVVLVLKHAVDEAAVESLQAAVKGAEVIRAGGRHLYITYPDGIGRSKLTNAFIEGRLHTRGTGRNWNTVLKIAAALGDPGGVRG